MKATIKAKMELITPALAKKWLETINVNNRGISQNRVGQYTQLMQLGLWDENNGDPIQLDVDGNLVNGQHRLKAIVNSGVELKMFIVRGVSRYARNTIDTGVSATNSALWKRTGAEYYRYWSAILTQLSYFHSRHLSSRKVTFEEQQIMKLIYQNSINELGIFDLTKGSTAIKRLVKGQIMLPFIVYYHYSNDSRRSKVRDLLREFLVNATDPWLLRLRDESITLSQSGGQFNQTKIVYLFFNVINGYLLYGTFEARKGKFSSGVYNDCRDSFDEKMQDEYELAKKEFIKEVLTNGM